MSRPADHPARGRRRPARARDHARLLAARDRRRGGRVGRRHPALRAGSRRGRAPPSSSSASPSAPGVPHAIATSSCTEALHLSLVAADIGAGDEVVTSSFTWPATVNAILHTGATPVFADVDPDTLDLDPEAARRAVTSRTRALLPVHFAGGPCDMDALGAIAAEHGLRTVEDAAHAVEADVRGRRVGAIGDFTCFSLYATKSLAGGEGGIITTRVRRRGRAAAAAAGARHHPRPVEAGADAHPRPLRRRRARASRPTWPTCRPPRRCRSSTASSASTPTAPSWSARYDDGLAALAGIEPIGRPAYGRHAHHLYVVRIDPALAGADRDRYAAALMAENVATGLHFLPVHTLTWYRRNLAVPALPVDRARRRAGAVAAARGGPLPRRHRRCRRRGAQGARRAHEVRIDRRTRVAVEAIVSAVVLGLLLRWAGIHEVAHTLRGTDLALVPAGRRRQRRRRWSLMALRWQMLLAAKDILGAAGLARRARTSSRSSPASSCRPRSAATRCAWSSSAGAPATRPRRSPRC